MGKIFDLSAYKAQAQETAKIDICHPATGEPLGVRIEVMSMDSDKYQQVSMRLQNENIKFARKNRGRTTAEKLASDTLELLVGVTVGWEGLGDKGQPLPFTPENCRRVYEEFPFIREQVDEFIGERRNFIKS